MSSIKKKQHRPTTRVLRGTLDGPSRAVEVEPITVPTQAPKPAREPERIPEREPAPARQG